MVLKEVESDEELQKIIHMLKEDLNSKPKFHLQQGKLMYRDRLVLSRLLTLFSHTFHDSILGGHLGFLRTKKRLTRELYWVGMKTYVKKYVGSCVICQ